MKPHRIAIERGKTKEEKEKVGKGRQIMKPINLTRESDQNKIPGKHHQKLTVRSKSGELCLVDRS